jgi:hypothetical protein
MLIVPDVLAMKMEAAFFSEIFVNCYYSEQCHSLEDSSPHAIALITQIPILSLVTARWYSYSLFNRTIVNVSYHIAGAM